MTDEIEGSETCSLRAQDAAAPFHALACERGTMELAGQALVLSEEITDLTGSHTDITGRYVHVGANDLVQFCHKRLTELHDLVVALASDGEIGSALTATHGQCGQRVLEGLLETEKLQDREVHRRVEPQSALVWANGAIELHTVANVHLYLTLVIDPGHTEGDDTFGLNDTLDDLGLLKFRMLVVNVLNRLQHLSYCL